MPVTYTINFTDPGKSYISLDPGAKNETDTSITLIGSGSTLYGEKLNENILHILENFAYDTAPSNPIEGQTWFDTVSQTLKMYNGTQWIDANTVVVDSVAPSSPVAGQLWLDTNSDQLKVYNGTSWSSVAGQYVSKAGDTMTGDLVMDSANIDMGGNTIVNLAQPAAPLGPNTPADPTQAATTQYVHDRFIDTQGDTMTGNLDLGGNLLQNVGTPGTDNDGMSRGYADTRYVNVSGDVMSGNLDLDSNVLQNVGDPTVGTDGMSRGYADTRYLLVDGSNQPVNGFTIPYGQQLYFESGTSDLGSIYKYSPAVDESHTRIRLSDNQSTTDYLDIGSDDGTWHSSVRIKANGTVEAGNLYLYDSVYFYDTDAGVYRRLFWSDTSNEWYVEDNSGTQQNIWHSGNLNSSNIMFESNFTVTTGRATINARSSTYSVSLESYWDNNYINVYPPSGYSMSNLMGFMPSIEIIYYNGDVDHTDTIFCRYDIRSTYIRVICNNNENRASARVQYIAIWRK